jgi:8-oxo-dGTP pyrophosphatase MutT (NUDIX family)
MEHSVSQWLHNALQQAQQPPLRPRQCLGVGGQVVGTVEESFVQRLGADLLHAHGLALEWSQGLWDVQGEGGATGCLNRLAQAMRAAGHCGPWRNEQLAVCNGQGRRIATIERGAVRPLGIATQAVHLVGTVADGRLWVQQRADDKPTHPGKWDTLMGGMVSAEDTLAQAVERETWEEAGLCVGDLQDMRHGGHVEFARPSDEAEGRGYMRERVDWYAVCVPAGLRPDNRDGEVQGFELLDRETVTQWLLEDRFTPEASLVLAAYFGWR